MSTQYLQNINKLIENKRIFAKKLSESKVSSVDNIQEPLRQINVIPNGAEDYYVDAKNNLMPYINNSDIVDKVLKSLDAFSINSVKYLVLDWGLFKPIMESIKNTTISEARLIEMLKLKVKEIIKKSELDAEKPVLDKPTLSNEEDMILKNLCIPLFDKSLWSS